MLRKLGVVVLMTSLIIPLICMPVYATAKGQQKLMAERATGELLRIIENGFPEEEKIIEIDHQMIERESVVYYNQQP